MTAEQAEALRRLAAAIGAFRSGTATTSVDHEDLLAESFGS